jgi:hypothetical protein
VIRLFAGPTLAVVFGSVLCACPSAPAHDAAKPAATPAAEESETPPAIPAPAGLPGEPGEAGVRKFLAGFLQARVIGDATRARDFLSHNALDQFERHEVGLNLVAISFTGWELLSVKAADASSWEVRVKMRREDEPTEEMLFVGPGADTSGTQRAWIVRGAGRP